MRRRGKLELEKLRRSYPNNSNGGHIHYYSDVPTQDTSDHQTVAAGSDSGSRDTEQESLMVTMSLNILIINLY